MATLSQNPFNITKAVDLTDQQIKDTWVDFPAAGGFFEIANPTSPMPLLLLGGKGSGRTHLMRYFSFPLQLLRHQNESAIEVLEDGYIGIYFRCSGLNAHRFSGKGQDTEKWSTVFSYYMDLWLGQVTLATFGRLLDDSPDAERLSALIAGHITSLFDLVDFDVPANIQEALDLLHRLQTELDVAINNAALTHELPITIRASPGRLVFGIPQVIASSWKIIEGVQVLYLLDELENLDLDQQKYINTLIREKESPTSFFIGSRSYGIKTYETFSGGEENKEGSEFVTIELDALYLSQRKQYRQLCRNIVAQRLIESGASIDFRDKLAARLDVYFKTVKNSELGDLETQFVLEKNEDERLYFSHLRKRLEAGRARLQTKGLSKAADIDELIGLLRVPEHPLIEKANCFLLFRAWSDGEDLLEAARALARSVPMAGSPEWRSTEQAKILKHFKYDLLAQLLREYDRAQKYDGLETFIVISGGMVRNLLVILKYIYQFASFAGEKPFSEEPISIKAQDQGVRKATEWYFNDAALLGSLGDDVRHSIEKLGNMFRRLRFSDKPSESSIDSFSVDLARCSEVSQATIRAAEKWSLLIQIERGQRERNSGQVDSKYQINPMLCPYWDLPIYRRGALSLLPEEADAIFDNSKSDDTYESVVSRRFELQTAPFGKNLVLQDPLPGLLDD